jgi:DNA-binding transcriptional ArsR family regulator
MGSSVEFEVSEKLKACGIKRIAQIGKSTLRAEYHDIPIVIKFDFDDFTASMKRFRKEAEKYITSNGAAAEKIVDDLVLHVTKVTSDYYENNGSTSGGESGSQGAAGVEDVGAGNTVLRMARRPNKATCSMEDWSKDVSKKHNDLKTIAENRLPGLWLPLEFAISVRSILHVKNIDLPFIAVILGPPSSNKSLAVDMFEGARYIFATDDFSAKSFVSHNSGVSNEELAKIDLLPKIVNKMFLVPELSPLFTTKDDELANVFGIITRIADGKGYVSDTGAKGHRGYRGRMMFVWLGAAVDIPYKIHKMLSNLGPKLYFLRLPATQETEDNLLQGLKEDDFKERLQEVNNVLYEYLELFESCPIMEPDPQVGNIPRLEMDAANPVQEDAQRYIIRLAELLAHLRGTVSTWETEGTQGLDYAYSTPYIENPKRAIQQLFNLARGHALSQGRDYITVDDDLPIVVKVVLSGAASIERVKVLNALLGRKDHGYLNVDDVVEATGTSEPTAKRAMAEFKALGLVDLIRLGEKKDGVEDPNAEIQIRLRGGFEWFLTDDFSKLKGDYMPGDFSRHLVKRSNNQQSPDHKKNTPHVEKKNNSDGMKKTDDSR